MTNTFVLHDDYEVFAHYLGIEYEDFVNMELGFDEEECLESLEYEIPSLV